MSKNKIRGWAARDRNGALFFHHEKPHRDYDCVWHTDWVMHPEPELHHLRLLDTMLPDITWSNEPVEVEIIVNKI